MTKGGAVVGSWVRAGENGRCAAKQINTHILYMIIKHELN